MARKKVMAKKRPTKKVTKKRVVRRVAKKTTTKKRVARKVNPVRKYKREIYHRIMGVNDGGKKGWFTGENKVDTNPEKAALYGHKRVAVQMRKVLDEQFKTWNWKVESVTLYYDTGKK